MTGTLKYHDGTSWVRIPWAKGDTGPQGPQGIQGIQGLTGPADEMFSDLVGMIRSSGASTKHYWSQQTITTTSAQPLSVNSFFMGLGRTIVKEVVDPILAVNITVAADAPSEFRFHIYDKDYNLVFESANLPATASGIIECVCTGLTLPPGFYFFGVRLLVEGATTNPTVLTSFNTTYQGGMFWDWTSTSKSCLPVAVVASVGGDLLSNFYNHTGQSAGRFVPIVGIR